MVQLLKWIKRRYLKNIRHFSIKQGWIKLKTKYRNWLKKNLDEN